MSPRRRKPQGNGGLGGIRVSVVRSARAGLARLRAPGWPGRAAALVAGAALPLSLAPFNVATAGLLSAAAALALLRGQSPKECAWRGWWHGFGMFGVGLSWVYVSIHDYGGANVGLAALLTLLFCAGLAVTIALPAWLYGKCFAQVPGPGWWLGFVAMWMLAEWLRLWLLGGLPWLYLGYAHLETALAGWLPVGGVFMASLAVAASAALLCALPSMSRPGKAAAAAAVCMIWGAGAALRSVDWVRAVDAPPLHAILVQGNVPLNLKWNKAYQAEILAMYRKLTERHWDSELIVWPEGAMPIYYVPGKGLLGWAERAARRHGATVIAGTPVYRANGHAGGQFFNSLVAVGDGHGEYHKRRLVPFGEFVPFQKWLRGLIQFFDLPMSNYSPGPSEPVLLKAGELDIAPSICYESAYPGLVADGARHADVLVNVSDDTWFGDSIGPWQHFEIVRVRALETGRPMLRVANSGITAAIGPRGEIIDRLERKVRGTLSVSLQRVSGQTPFLRYGSTPVWTLSMLFALAGLAYRHAGARRRS